MGLSTLEQGFAADVFFELTNVRRTLDEAAIIAVTDLKGDIIFANDKFCRISRYSRQELLGQNHRIINSGYHPKEFFQDLWKTIISGRIWHGDIRNRAKDGSFYWVDTTIIPLLGDNGRPFQYVSIRFEITEKKKMEEMIRDLPQRIIAAQEEERGRIAQAIHDDFGQMLVALKMFAAMHAADVNCVKPEFDLFCKDLQIRINAAIDKARNLSHELALPAIKYKGLVKCLKDLIGGHRFDNKTAVKFLHRNLSHADFSANDIILYRIIQEALTNIAKHAGAHNVDIRLIYKNGKVFLTIKDDGRGFDVREQNGLHKGIGLALIRERAKLMGAALQIVSAKGKGTMIRLSVAVAEKNNV